MSTTLEQTQGLLAYVKTIQGGSFSGAARGLGTTPSAISKSVARLERRLGVRLLQRSTRVLTPTQEGLAYYERVEPLLRALDQAGDEIRSPDKVQGLLRVSAPSDLGRMLMSPIAKVFAPAHPALKLDIRLSDRRVDLIREGIDIAIRVGRLDDSDLNARLLAKLPLVLVASPGYLAQHGAPSSVEALARHAHVRYLQGGEALPITFDDGRTMNPNGVFDTDAGDALRIAAVNGLGIVQILRSAVQTDLEQGTLLPVMSEHPLPLVPVHAIHAFGRHAPARARMFIEFVAGQLATT